MRRRGGGKTISDLSGNAINRQGAYYALAAYLMWGVAPVYFVWVGFAQPLEVLAERIVWSVPLLGLLVTAASGWSELRNVSLRNLSILALCSVLLSINWLTFIYAIDIGKIAETSLGYFINPLISILLGRIFLGESMSGLHWVATGLAAGGVFIELVSLGEVPWLGLSLAFSFGFYGLLRKRISLGAPLALGLETALIAPLALAYLMFFELPDRTITQSAYLAMGGLVTVLPLVCFGAAAARLPLSQLGFFQYIAPTLSLLIALFVYGEIVTTERWINLGLIWAGLALYSVDSFVKARGRLA